MKKTTLLKGCTLVLFISGISAFIYYRTGGFDPYLTDNSAPLPLQTSPNGGAMSNSTQTDTTPPKPDSSRRAMFSSSKVMILPRDKRVIDSADAVKRRKGLERKKQERIMFSGSKSGFIVEPSRVILPLPDSLKRYRFDSSKIKTPPARKSVKS